MEVVRSSAAASQETSVFVKKWWGRLAEASAKTGTTYLTPTSQPSGKLSVIRSAIDVIVDILELHSQVLGMVVDLDRVSPLTRYVDSDDLPTCFAANKLLVILANHGLIRSESRDVLLSSVVSRLELVQSILQPESPPRLPLTDVSLNLTLSPPIQNEESVSSKLRAQMEAVHVQLVLSTCALLETQSSSDNASLSFTLCQAVDMMIEQIKRHSSTSLNKIVSAERAKMASLALTQAVQMLSRVTGEEQQSTVRFFFTRLEDGKIDVLKSDTMNLEGTSMLRDLIGHTATLQALVVPDSQARLSPGTPQSVFREEQVGRSPETAQSESSRYEAMEDSDTVQLDASSDDDNYDDRGSHQSSPMVQSGDEVNMEGIDSAMQSLAVGSLPNHQHQHHQLVDDDMHSIDVQVEWSRWKAMYELTEADRIRLEQELAARESKELELELKCNDATSRLQLMTELSQVLEASVEAKSQQLEEARIFDASKAAKMEVLERGLDEAWAKLKVIS